MSLGPRAGLVGAVGLLTSANLLNNWLAPSAYVATGVVTSALLLGLFRLAGGTWADAGLGRGSRRRGLRWAAALAGATVAAGIVLAVAGVGPEGLAFAALVRVPLGTALLEEVGFRGVVYGLARRLGGVGWATTLSSALFGLWHVLPAMTIAAGAGVGVWAVGAAILASAIAGAVLCELRRRSGSLIPCIVVHWCVNALGYVGAYFL